MTTMTARTLTPFEEVNHFVDCAAVSMFRTFDPPFS